MFKYLKYCFSRSFFLVPKFFSRNSLVIFACPIANFQFASLVSSAIVFVLSKQNKSKKYKFTILLSLFATNFHADMSLHSHKQLSNSPLSAVSARIRGTSRYMSDNKRRNSQLSMVRCRCRFFHFLCRKVGGFQSRLVSAKEVFDKKMH